MRVLLAALLVTTPGCIEGFNKVALKHWYPPPDTDTKQLCTGNRASRCTDDALKLIDPAVAQKQPDQAARLLGAACEQGDTRACSTLDTRFTAPKRLDPIPEFGAGLPHSLDAYGEVACTITVQGEAIKCRGLMDGGHNGAYIDALLRNRFTPAMLDGVPFESEYIERYFIRA